RALRGAPGGSRVPLLRRDRARAAAEGLLDEVPRALPAATEGRQARRASLDLAGRARRGGRRHPRAGRAEASAPRPPEAGGGAPLERARPPARRRRADVDRRPAARVRARHRRRGAGPIADAAPLCLATMTCPY